MALTWRKRRCKSSSRCTLEGQVFQAPAEKLINSSSILGLSSCSLIPWVCLIIHQLWRRGKWGKMRKKECERREGRTKEDRRKYKKREKEEMKKQEKTRRRKSHQYINLILMKVSLLESFSLLLKHPHISIFKRNGHMEVKIICPQIFKYVFLVILPFHCCKVKSLFFSLHS